MQKIDPEVGYLASSTLSLSTEGFPHRPSIMLIRYVRNLGKNSIYVFRRDANVFYPG